MEKILTASEMKQYDMATIKNGTPSLVLMERAARAAFEILINDFPCRRVLVCCGNGNNGGDGLAMARLLAAHGIPVTVCYLGAFNKNGTPDTAAMSEECATQYTQLPPEIPVLPAPDFQGVSVVVDAILGIGISRPLTPEILEVVQAINAARLPVLAIDIPTGIHADSGAVMGGAVVATKTIAIAAKKYGHLLFPGTQLCGEVIIADIGIEIDEVRGRVLEQADLAALPPRPRRAHKGTFGRVLVVGGSPNMSGAALLAAKAAYRAGAGLVEIFAPEENRLVYQIALPEAIVTCYNDQNAPQQLKDALARADAIALGMGLSQGDTAKMLVEHTLNTQGIPLVIDADALNLIAADMALRTRLYLREGAVLTPHPMEMSRLSLLPLSEVMGDLPRAALSLAKDSGKTVVLKDAHTIIAHEERLFFNTYGNSGMATGGSGDVLAGIIASLAAQGSTLQTAATCGVLAHALAGDIAKERHGNHGLLARDIVEALSYVLP
ncbi:MAG: NAD(P)H-hydrate dehydratase [Clostridia bacterium]|nr:NAD(P)H-hydrate dehydratase [Clostridia bacterium]